MKITIVVPVYNEEEKVVDVLKELSKTRFHVIVVDDGSTDNSLNKIKNLKLKNFIVLQHKINLGKGAALKTGCEYAFTHSADAVIMVDSDGQHKVVDLPRFVEKLGSNKYDVVFGSRNLNLGVPLDRYMGNKLASVLVGFMFGIYVSDLICGFRGLTKKAYKKIKWESTGYGVETEMVIRTKKNGLSHCEVPVETVYYDNYKGVSIIDALGVLVNLFRWRLTLK
jgi:glycosyltransferase involved in cell wall biosynthesis